MFTKLKLFLAILLPNIALLILFALLVTFIPTSNILFMPYLALIGLGMLVIIIVATSRIYALLYRPLNDIANEIKKNGQNYKPSEKTPKELQLLTKSVQALSMKLKQAELEKKKALTDLTAEVAEKEKKLQIQEEATVEVLKEIEKEKKISEVIAQDLKKYKLAVDKASDHILITDHNGLILYNNQAGEDITGYTVDEVLDKEASILYGERMNLSFWTELKNIQQGFKGEIQNKKKNGEEYIAEISISPIMNKNGEVIFFVVLERDITLAKEVDKMKTEFISLASHQLRTPLTSMKWGLEAMLGHDLGTLTEKQQEYVDDIYNSNKRLISLVEGLLNVSRIESGRILIEPEMTDVTALVNDIVKELGPKSTERNIAVSIQSEQLPEINIDPKLVREIYLNIISNAIKYSHEGESVNINLYKKDGYVVSEIKDHGVGIPEQNIGDIFNKFYRAENAVKILPDGTGLGLYLAKSLVELMNGTIWFESVEGKGTTFWFTLPVKGVEPRKGEVTIV